MSGFGFLAAAWASFGVGDADAATQRVVNGQADYSNAAIPPDRIALVGNTMIDTLLANVDGARDRAAWQRYGLARGGYVLVTLHRPALVDDPDLLVRTSGEMRISNFLLWQIAYAELYVTGTLWPDFTRGDLLRAVLEYQKRDRRYGGLSNGSAQPVTTPADEDLIPALPVS